MTTAMATVLPMKGWKSCGSRAETGRATATGSSAVRLSPWARTVAGATKTTADTLADEPSWRERAAQHDVVGDATARDLEHLRDLRESIRAGLLANHDRTPPPRAHPCSPGRRDAVVKSPLGVLGVRSASASRG